MAEAYAIGRLGLCERKDGRLTGISPSVYRSLLTNGTVYAAAFLLYLLGAWSSTSEDVMVLFSLGMLTDTFLTVFFHIKPLYMDHSNR